MSHGVFKYISIPGRGDDAPRPGYAVQTRSHGPGKYHRAQCVYMGAFGYEQCGGCVVFVYPPALAFGCKRTPVFFHSPFDGVCGQGVVNARRAAFPDRVHTIGKQGLVEGAIVCWRFLLVVALGLVFISTTRVSEIKRSVAWFFQPVPGVPEKRVATMLGLIVRFIPVIFKKAGEVTMAQHARCIGSRKNPFFRLKIFTIPLLRSVFRDAGNLAMAMEARCYSEHGAIHVAAASRNDWILLIAGSSLCVVALFG